MRHKEERIFPIVLEIKSQSQTKKNKKQNGSSYLPSINSLSIHTLIASMHEQYIVSRVEILTEPIRLDKKKRNIYSPPFIICFFKIELHKARTT